MAEESLFASVLTFAEIRRGIELLPVGRRRTQLEQWQGDLVASFEMRLFPVTRAIADHWAIISAQTQRRGISLANIDGPDCSAPVPVRLRIVLVPASAILERRHDR